MTLLAFALRAYRLAGQSIWYDEGLSVYYARRPLPELLALVSGSDHPPLYFLLLHLWLRITAFGRPTVEFLVRYPSLVFGVLLVPLVYVFGRRILGELAGLAAAGLMAVSPFHIWYSQEARMYTLVVFLTLGASYALWSALKLTLWDKMPSCPTETPFSCFTGARRSIAIVLHSPGPPWTIYSLVMALALYAHFYAGFILIAHAVFVIWWAWQRDCWRTALRWAGAVVVAVLIFLPWGGLVAGQLQANDTYWRGRLDLWRTISEAIQAFAVGETVEGPVAVLTTAAYLLLAAIGLGGAIDYRRRVADRAMFLLGYVLIPLIVLLAIAYNRPKFAPRYLLTVTPALALLAGHGVALLRRPGPGLRSFFLRSMTIALLGGLVILGRGLALWRHYTDESQFKADWRAAAQYINDQATPRDAVVIVAGHAMPAFDFYNPRQLDVYPMPPRLLPTVTHPVEMADVTTALNRLVKEGHDRVWLILWQERLADPRRLTLNLLFENGRRLGIDRRFHGLSMLLFELPPGTVFEPFRPDHRLDVLFGAHLRLEGYDLSSTVVAPGETLTLRLYWRGVRPMTRDYTAFTQLLSAEDRIVGQHDRRLGGDFYPTSHWPVGEPVRETYKLTVAPDTPPGRYRLIAGVYLAPTGPRLPAIGNNTVVDHVIVEEIEVRLE